MSPDRDPERRLDISLGETLALLAIVFVGLSYRLYLARFHTDVGIAGMASWWDYIVANAVRILEGRPFQDTLYAPGQAFLSFLFFRLFHADPAVLRVCFGALDGLAIVFLYLAVKEVGGQLAGLLSGFAYSLWPEGASASVNILHDQSPQPLFLFAGLWLTLLWLRRRQTRLLVAGGFLLGLPPLFRKDAILVTLAVPAALVALELRAGRPRLRALLTGCLLFAATVLPSLPWDIHIYRRTGRFLHISAGDPGAAIFLRFGRDSPLGGMRFADSEIAFVSGTGQPFGFDWTDARRSAVLTKYGNRALLADPIRYVTIVAGSSWEYLENPAAARMWLPPGFSRLSDIGVSGRLESPEWPQAVLVSASRIQGAVGDRRLLLLVALAALVTSSSETRTGILLVSAGFLLWSAVILFLIPDSRYLLMPMCLVLVLFGPGLVSSFRIIAGFAKSRIRGVRRWFSSRTEDR